MFCISACFYSNVTQHVLYRLKQLRYFIKIHLLMCRRRSSLFVCSWTGQKVNFVYLRNKTHSSQANCTKPSGRSTHSAVRYTNTAWTTWPVRFYDLMSPCLISVAIYPGNCVWFIVQVEEMKHTHKLELSNVKLECVRAKGEIERDRDALQCQVEGKHMLPSLLLSLNLFYINNSVFLSQVCSQILRSWSQRWREIKTWYLKKSERWCAGFRQRERRRYTRWPPFRKRSKH